MKEKNEEILKLKLIRRRIKAIKFSGIVALEAEISKTIPLLNDNNPKLSLVFREMIDELTKSLEDMYSLREEFEEKLNWIIEREQCADMLPDD